MGFETNKFGDGSAEGSGNVVQSVSNHYGPREIGAAAGDVYTAGVNKQLVLAIDPATLANDGFQLVTPVIPALSKITSVKLEISEAFGASGTAQLGTKGSEAANGADIANADITAVGIVDLTGTITGTWADPLTDSIEVGITHGGTINDATVGKGRIVIEYFRV